MAPSTFKPGCACGVLTSPFTADRVLCLPKLRMCFLLVQNPEERPGKTSVSDTSKGLWLRPNCSPVTSVAGGL